MSYPNDEFIRLYETRNDQYKYTQHFYCDLDTEKHLFFSVSSKNILYIIRENQGKFGAAPVAIYDTGSEPTSVYVNYYDFTLKQDWNVLWNPYVYGVNYYPGNLVIPAHDFDSEEELIEFLKSFNSFNDLCDSTSSDYGGNVDSNRLPLLNFKIKQALTSGDWDDLASVKYTFDWSVSQHDIYANNPNSFYVQMLATAKYHQESVLGTTSVVAEDLKYINPECNFYVDTAIPIYKESYSFRERDVRYELCKKAGVNANDSSVPLSYYYLFVRVVEPDTQKTSLWKVYKCQGRNITQTGFYYDEDGNEYSGSSDDEIDDGTNYDDDYGTDSDDSPTSPFYNDGAEIDAQHLLNNLEEIVSTLKGIPELFEKVFLWMPDYLVVLIATSIGLLLVIGFVKMFLR